MAFLDLQGLSTLVDCIKSLVNAKLADKLDANSVDKTLSDSSANPIQNMVVTAALNNLDTNKPNIHCGTDVPSDSLGKDGDLYIQLNTAN